MNLVRSALGVAMGCLLMLVTACGGDSGTFPSAGTGAVPRAADSAAADPTPTDKPACELLSIAEAERLTDVQPLTAKLDVSDCEYSDSAGNGLMSVSVQSMPTTESPANVLQDLTANGTYEPETGIGDAAVYGPADSVSGYQLDYIIGRPGLAVFVEVSIDPDVPDASRQMVEAVARVLEKRV